MTKLSVSNYLARLQTDPFDQASVEGLREVVASRDPEALGDDPVRLLELARVGHERRAEFYAAAALIEIEAAMIDDDPSFKAALYRELGRLRREELLDERGAVVAYEAALELDPEDDESQEALEQLEHAAASWRQIAERFIEEASTASDPTLKASFLSRAASTLWIHGGPEEHARVDDLFQQAVSVDPGQMRPTRLYSVVLRQQARWEELARLLLTTGDAGRNRDEKLQCYLHAARLRRGVLADPDGAAACYERVLDFTPGQREAMEFLVEYFTEREQWDHVVAVYDDALRARQKLEDEQGTLLQIGMVHWRMRGDAESAEPYFARLRKLDPKNGAMLGFYEAYYDGGDPEGKLVGILGDAQRVVTDPTEKLALSIRLAQAAQKSGIVEKAIDAWKAVQRLDRGNALAAEALRDLYAKGDKWNALVEVLRSELDGLGDDQKERKLEILEELVRLYRDQLGLDVMVVQTCTQILDLDPRNQGAFDELTKTYESLGRWNELLQLLARRADAESDREAKVALLMRQATLWIERFANFNQATRPLEMVVELDPENRAALSQLRQIYAKKRAWAKLAEVLERELSLGAEDPLAVKTELAQIRGERLHEYDAAIAMWRGVIQEGGDAAEAYDQIEKLAERAQDWASLADALEAKIAASGDDATRATLLQKLGQTLGEKLGDAARAADAWRRLLEIDPRNGRALRTLRESYLAARDYDALEALYAETEDWEGLVDVLGKGAEKATEAADKIELSFRAAAVYEDRIGEPHRAFRSYERVLAVEPKNVRAARALLPIYERDEKWARLVEMLEILFDAPEIGAEERVEFGKRVRDLRIERLSDEAGALAWASKVYALAPNDDDVIRALERIASSAGRPEVLVETYRARLAEAGEEEQLALRRRIATIAGEKLGQVDEAIEQLRRILDARPNDGEALRTLDRLYRAQDRIDDLAALYAHRLAHAEDDQVRLDTLLGLAKLEEEVRGDIERAAARFREVLELEPAHAAALEALDRLATRGGWNEELADVLARRLDLRLDDAVRADVEARLGHVLAFSLGDPAEAVVHFGRALEIDKGQAKAIEGLERVEREHPAHAVAAGRHLEPAYVRRGNYRRLSEVLAKRLEASTDEGEKQELRLRLAELSASELNDPKGAFKALEAAFLDSPGDPDLWDRLAGVAEAAGMHEALAEAYATAIDASDLDPGSIAELAGRAAEIYDVVLGQPERAEPFHKKRLVLDPLDERSFVALKELYTTSERWDDLQALYRHRIAETTDADGKLELLRQVCFLFEEILEEPDLAIQSYQAVLELAPDHEPSRVALERLYRQRGRHRDLAAMLAEKLSAADGQEAIELALELGAIHEKHLEEPGPAVDYYEQVLERNPRNLHAQEALERLIGEPTQRQRIATLLEPLYESQGAWPELTRVLEVQLEAAGEPGLRVSLLLRLAEIAERNLGDLGRTFDALSRAVAADPSDASARSSLLRVARKRGTLDEAARALLAAAEASGTPYVEAEILGEVGVVLQDELRDGARAESVWTRLLEIDPDNPDVVIQASKALERIHLERGDFQTLVEDLRRQVRFEDDVDARASLLIRIADLYEIQLEDRESAIRTHRERLEHDPADLGALRALERLHEQAGAWQELIGVLQSHETVAESEDEQREICRRIGEIYERELRDTDNAIVAYNEVLSRFGPDDVTLVSLSRLYEATEKWDDLREALEMRQDLEHDERRRAELRFQIAELMRTKTNSVEGAIEIYRDVLDVVPEHRGAIEALSAIAFTEGSHRVEAARVLRPIFESSGDHEKLALALEAIGEGDDPVERVEALRRAAEVVELAGEDLPRAFRLAGRALLLGAGGDDVAVLVRELRRVAELADDPRGHVEVLRTAAPDIMDGDVVVEVLMEIATIARDRLEDPALAREYFEKALENQPEHRGALESLDRLFVQLGDHDALADVLRRKAEIAETEGEQIAVLMRLSQIYEDHLDDAPNAIDCLERVLDTGAAPLEAYVSLDRLYRSTRRWDDLIRLLERQIDENVGDANAVRLSLASVLLEKRDDPYAAFELLQQNLAPGREHGRTVEYLEGLMAGEAHRGDAARLLEPVYLARMDWAKVSAALDARLAIEDDISARKEIFERMGQLHEDYLEDLDGALEAYARLFREDPYDKASWETLTRLARAQDNWTRLADIFAGALAEIETDGPESAELAAIAGKHYLDHAGLAEKAAPLFMRAFRFDPTTPDVFEYLERCLKQIEDWDSLIQVYREAAEVAESDEERVGILRRAATVEEVRRGNIEAAIGLHREALEIDPAYEPSLEAVERLLSVGERWEEVADHLRFQIDGAVDDDHRHDLQHRLATLTLERLGDVDEAIRILEEVVVEAPTHAASVATLERLVTDEAHQLRITEILEPIYRASDEWRKLVAVLEAQARANEDASEKSRLLAEVARLHEERGGDPSLAFDAWSRAFEIDPYADEARDEVDRLADELGRWEELVKVYERAAERSAEEPHRAAELLEHVARIYDERLGDTTAAIATYTRLAELVPDDPAPLDALEGLQTMNGDWLGLVDVLERKVEREMDPIARGELLRRAASVVEELVVDPERAIQLYARAAAEDETDTAALVALDRLYTQAANHAALAEVLERLVELQDSDAERVALGLRLASVYELQLEDADKAIEALRGVTSIVPDHGEALGSLARLFERRGEYRDYVDVVRTMASYADGAERVSLVHRVGEVLERKLDDVDEAIATYEEALGLDPAHAPSREALLRIAQLEQHRENAAQILEPLLREQGRFDDLAGLLELRAAGASDPFEKRERLRELAIVHDTGRRDERAAFDAYARAFAEDPADEEILAELDRLADATGQHGALADLLERSALGASDPEVAVRLFARAAELAERNLGDDARAARAMAQAVEHAGDRDELLVELDRLYVKTESWNELGPVLERRVDLVFEPEAQVELLVRLGELRRARYADLRGAYEAFSRVLDVEPSEARATAALVELGKDESLAADVVDVLDRAYRAAGDLRAAAELYDLRLDLVGSAGEKVALLNEAAGLWEQDLGEPARALDCLVRAFGLDPSDVGLIDEIERLANATGETERLRGLVEKAESVGLDGLTRRDLNLRAAAWYRDALRDPEAAEARLRSAIEGDPEASEAYSQLVALVRGQGDRVKLVADLVAWASHEPDESVARELRLEAAGLHREIGNLDAAIEQLEAILAQDPSEPVALAELTTLREARGEWPEVAGLLERRIDVEMDGDARLALRRKLGDLLAGPLAEPARAIDAFMGILDEDPTDLAAMSSLEKLYEQAERWEDLRDLLERRLDVAETDADRVVARVRMARLEEQAFGRRDEAMEQLREILEMDPENGEALDELERLLLLEERHDEVAELLEKRAAKAASDDERRARLLRLAQIEAEKIGDAARAASTYERILAQRADDLEVLEALAALHLASGNDAAAAEVLERSLAHRTGDDAKAKARELATLAREKLGDATLEERALKHAFDLDRGDAESRAALKAFHERHGNVQALADLLVLDLEEAADEGAKIDLLKRIASLYTEKLGDPATAAAYLERAVELKPDDRETLLQLCDIYVDAGRQNDAIPVLEKIIESFGGRRSKELAAYHHRLGRALEGLGQTEKALEHYDAAFKIDLTNVPVLRDLGKLTYRSGDYDRAQKTFRALLLQKLDDAAGITKADVYYYLGDMSAKQGDAKKAISMLERALTEQKDHAEAAALLAELKGG